MTWQPPEPAVPASILIPEQSGMLGPLYTLAQLLAVRHEALEQCLEIVEKHNYGQAPSLIADDIRKLGGLK